MNPQPLLDDVVGPAVIISILGIVFVFVFAVLAYEKKFIFRWLIGSVIWVLIVCIGSAIIYNTKWADYNRQQRYFQYDPCEDPRNSSENCIRIEGNENFNP